MNQKPAAILSVIIATVLMGAFSIETSAAWQSKFVKLRADGSLDYIPDSQGNIIPDFSRVGYFAGDKEIPDVEIVKTVEPVAEGSSQEVIQNAINELSEKAPGPNGWRGAILLKKGVYRIPGTITVQKSGIVLRGEGNSKERTVLLSTAKKKVSVVSISGENTPKRIDDTKIKIIDDYVPVGTFSFHVSSVDNLHVGDKIMVFRPGTKEWIHDIKMDEIADTKDPPWKPAEYNLRFERVITQIEGNQVYIDNPIVMAMETKYGGGEIYPYHFDGRISNVGVENIYFQSEYGTDTDENHADTAVIFNKTENGWVRNVTAQYFVYSCVRLLEFARNITVVDCNCIDAKSQITGGRRYSFCNRGQLNLFMNCHASDGRHDFVTHERTCGPNVFCNSTAQNVHGDIGPHHRWATGTLYDCITTTGEINVHDRGNWGGAHGWPGVTQILWNCKVRGAAIQNPWASAKNYCIGLQGEKLNGRFPDRPNGEWEGQNKDGLEPHSLYLAQLKARKLK